MGEIQPARLRQLVFKFYSENDPAKLQMGLDINGIVEWTMRNGVTALNTMLNKQFGKTIDLNEDTGDAKKKFERMSLGLTFSTQIARKETDYRIQLAEFFTKYDPGLMDPDKESQFEKFVKFVMLNGMDKLNEKLIKKYGAGINSNGVAEKAKQKSYEAEEDRPVVDLNAGMNNYGLDVDRLKDDLTLFYEEMQDEEQLEVLDEIVDWACQIGMEEFNNKIEQMYGTSLNTFLENEGRQTHVNKAQEPAPVPRPVPATPARPAAAPTSAPTPGMGGQGAMQSSGVRQFEDMSDAEIRAELTAFYNKHDPDNIEKIDQVIELARQLGRADLNDKLSAIYGEPLEPLKVPAIAKRDTAKPPGLGFQTGFSTRLAASPTKEAPPAKKEEFEADGVKWDEGGDEESDAGGPPPMPPRMDDEPDETHDEVMHEMNDLMATEPERPKVTTNPYDTTPVVLPVQQNHDDTDGEDEELELPQRPTPTPQELPQPKNQMMEEMKEAVKAKPPVQNVEDILASEREMWRQQSSSSIPLNETPFQRKAREMRERNQGGKSRVRGADGKIKEINILLDACSKYRLDVFSGICTCGFSKSDHNTAAKYEVNANIDGKNVRNSRGLLDVKNFVKNLAKNAPTTAPSAPKPKPNIGGGKKGGRFKK